MKYYSQYKDIQNPQRKSKGCGIAALAMLFSHYDAGKEYDLDTLFDEGVLLDAYIQDVGWKHQGLIDIAKKHGYSGKRFDWSGDTEKEAFDKLKKIVSITPVMVSVYKNYNPEEKGGHLVVMREIYSEEVAILDPNAHTTQEGQRSMAVNDFMRGWKRRGVMIWR